MIKSAWFWQYQFHKNSLSWYLFELRLEYFISQNLIVTLTLLYFIGIFKKNSLSSKKVNLTSGTYLNDTEIVFTSIDM